MTKAEETILVKEAELFLGESWNATDGRGHILEANTFVGIEKWEVSGEFKPKAVFRSERGYHWTSDLKVVIDKMKERRLN